VLPAGHAHFSPDELQMLLRSRVNPAALRLSQTLADDMAKLLAVRLDPHRFPWVAAARRPTGVELDAAKLATAVLTTASAARAGRRSDARIALERRVQEVLAAFGFALAAKPSRGI
jgi:hypothetical protein